MTDAVAVFKAKQVEATKPLLDERWRVALASAPPQRGLLKISHHSAICMKSFLKSRPRDWGSLAYLVQVGEARDTAASLRKSGGGTRRHSNGLEEYTDNPSKKTREAMLSEIGRSAGRHAFEEIRDLFKGGQSNAAHALIARLRPPSRRDWNAVLWEVREHADDEIRASLRTGDADTARALIACMRNGQLAFARYLREMIIQGDLPRPAKARRRWLRDATCGEPTRQQMHDAMQVWEDYNVEPSRWLETEDPHLSHTAPPLRLSPVDQETTLDAATYLGRISLDKRHYKYNTTQSEAAQAMETPVRTLERARQLGIDVDCRFLDVVQVLHTIAKSGGGYGWLQFEKAHEFERRLGYLLDTAPTAPSFSEQLRSYLTTAPPDVARVLPRLRAADAAAVMQRGTRLSKGRTPMAILRELIPRREDAGEMQRIYAMCRNAQFAELYEAMSTSDLRTEAEKRRLSLTQAVWVHTHAMRQRLRESDDTWAQEALVFRRLRKERRCSRCGPSSKP